MKMVVIKVCSMLSIFIFSLVILSAHSSSLNIQAADSFINCLSSHHKISSNISILSAVYATTNSSYQSILESTISNLRFLTPNSTLKPVAIITPLVYSHVQAAVVCSKQNGLRIRIRSGGHDFEGLSYRSQVPFVILDLRNLRSIRIDIEDNTGWVESGATLGELFYSIAERSRIHGFPAGVHPGIGIGGHFSGGGVGNLVRKYGLAADHVVDALMVDVNGRILDKNSMGSDLFWAIKGGGGASFGVILAWKIKLVHVPPVVTVFKLTKTLEEGAIDLVHKWQYVLGPKLEEDVIIGVTIGRGYGAMFYSLFLGRAEELLEMMEGIFPELQLREEDCIEMSWVESFLHLSDYPSGLTIDVIKNRSYGSLLPKASLKLKSDLVRQPLLPREALEGLWKRVSEVDSLTIIFQPYGGIMDRISESEIPFPHRKGVVYEILYLALWMEDEDKHGESSCSEKHMINLNHIRGLYEFMTPYVPNSPRAAYLNSRDLDFGTNVDDHVSAYAKAKDEWGSKYFKNNFKKLAIVKGKVDPSNFFYHEQSIPPLDIVSQQEQRNKCTGENMLMTSLIHQCPSQVVY